MTKRALLIIAAIVVAVLFSFTTFAQEQGQEAATEGSKKTITYSDLQAQRKAIEVTRTSLAQVKAEYDVECVGKTFTANDDGIRKCREKSVQLTNGYSELKKDLEAYNKNLAQYKANNEQTSPDAIGSSAQSKKGK